MTIPPRDRATPDRADVIVPAGHIYLSAMEWARVHQMIVPDIGLKDGILQTLFEDHFDEISAREHHADHTLLPSVQSSPTEVE